jgi:hypothetical protein
MPVGRQLLPLSHARAFQKARPPSPCRSLSPGGRMARPHLPPLHRATRRSRTLDLPSYHGLSDCCIFFDSCHHSRRHCRRRRRRRRHRCQPAGPRPHGPQRLSRAPPAARARGRPLGLDARAARLSLHRLARTDVLPAFAGLGGLCVTFYPLPSAAIALRSLPTADRVGSSAAASQTTSSAHVLGPLGRSARPFRSLGSATLLSCQRGRTERSVHGRPKLSRRGPGRKPISSGPRHCLPRSDWASCSIPRSPSRIVSVSLSGLKSSGGHRRPKEAGSSAFGWQPTSRSGDTTTS